MVFMWLGELYYCSCLPVLPGPAWVLLAYGLQTFISGSVQGDIVGLSLPDLGLVEIDHFDPLICPAILPILPNSHQL